MGVSAPSLHRESTDSLINVAGMSWPVRYGEVATLAQEFLEGLKPPNFRNDGVPAPPTRLISVPDG